MSLRSASVLTVISLAALTAAACSPKLAPSRDAPNPPVSGPPVRVDLVDPDDHLDDPVTAPANAPTEPADAQGAASEASATPTPTPAPAPEPSQPAPVPVVHIEPEPDAEEAVLVPAAATHCRVEERTLYNCPFADGRVASVCVGDQIAYRFGPLGEPELDLTRELEARSVHYGARSREGDERQSHVRFRNGAYDYVVYSGEQAGAGRSGVVVQHGRETIRRLQCPVVSEQTAIPVAMIRDSVSRESERRYDRWW